MIGRMDKSEKTRKLILGSALIATLGLIVLIKDEEEIYPIQPVQSMQPKKSYSETASVNENNSEYLDVDKLGQRKFSARAGELFNSKSWVISRPRNNRKQQAVQRSAPPTAPPLQFKYLGKVIDGNQTKIILSQSGKNIVVKLGERIDDEYRFDAIDNEAITLTYLPLNVEQTLIINNPGNIR